MKAKNFFAVLVSMFALLMTACETPNDNGGGDENVTFEISVSDITSSGATVSVVPSDKSVMYYFDKVPQETYKAYKNDAEFMKAMVEALRAYVEVSGSSLFSSISVGEDSHTYSGELAPATDYYIFAFAIDSKLNPNSKLALKEFTTDNAKVSDNTFEIYVNGGFVAGSPSNNDPYFWTVEPSDIYAGQNDDFIMTDLIEY